MLGVLNTFTVSFKTLNMNNIYTKFFCEEYIIFFSPMILEFFEQNKLQMILSNFFEEHLTSASGNYAAQNGVSEGINGQLWSGSYSQHYKHKG